MDNLLEFEKELDDFIEVIDAEVLSVTKTLTIVNNKSGSGFITCHSIGMNGLPQ